jgi:hypothetical protein
MLDNNPSGIAGARGFAHVCSENVARNTTGTAVEQAPANSQMER